MGAPSLLRRGRWPNTRGHSWHGGQAGNLTRPRTATITIAGEASRRYALQLHLADATPGAIRASLDGLDLTATCAAGVLEVGTPIMRGGEIAAAW